MKYRVVVGYTVPSRTKLDEDERNAHDTERWIASLQDWAPRPYDLKQLQILDAQEKARQQD